MLAFMALSWPPLPGFFSASNSTCVADSDSRAASNREQKPDVISAQDTAAMKTKSKVTSL